MSEEINGGGAGPVGRTNADWEARYESEEVEGLPWFYEALDPDVDGALARLGLSGGRFLDLGTGPGTQAIAMAARGFSVTACDVSKTAVEKARARADKAGAAVTFVVDDIMDSKLEGAFDLVLDRGCFHVFSPEQRPGYRPSIERLVRPGGHLFLKTFSSNEPPGPGPFRFSPEMIRSYFEEGFEVLSIDETRYFGTRDPLPIALFSVLRRRG